MNGVFGQTYVCTCLVEYTIHNTTCQIHSQNKGSNLKEQNNLILYWGSLTRNINKKSTRFNIITWIQRNRFDIFLYILYILSLPGKIGKDKPIKLYTKRPKTGSKDKRSNHSWRWSIRNLWQEIEKMIENISQIYQSWTEIGWNIAVIVKYKNIDESIKPRYHIKHRD